MYGGYKSIICFSRMNPSVAEYLTENYYTNDFGINLNEEGFYIAFSVSSMDEEGLSLEDPDFVEWAPMLIQENTGSPSTYTPLPFAKCTENDFRQMYPPHPNQKDKFEYLRL